MKKCPFCAEEIQDEAVKCRYCGELLEEKKKLTWYFRTSVIILALLSVGPLALPLVWFNPQYSQTKKLLWTGIVLIISYFLFKSTAAALKVLNEYSQAMSG